MGKTVQHSTRHSKNDYQKNIILKIDFFRTKNKMLSMVEKKNKKLKIEKRKKKKETIQNEFRDG
jgi:hypothetical protein